MSSSSRPGASSPVFDEGCQRLVGLVQLAAGHRGVQLHHLFARGGAGVLHGDGDTVTWVPATAAWGRPTGEGGVAQAVAKGEQGLFAHGVKIAVAHVDALGVAGVVGLGEVAHLSSSPPTWPR